MVNGGLVLLLVSTSGGGFGTASCAGSMLGCWGSEGFPAVGSGIVESGTGCMLVCWGSEDLPTAVVVSGLEPGTGWPAFMLV